MAAEKRPITIDDLYNIATIEDPRISPDGQWIAYVHMTVDKLRNDYQRNIWLVSTDGDAPIPLTRGDKDSNPRWSPDGKTLAFVSGRGKKPQIYLLPVGVPGGEARALTKALNGAHSPAWSPDGKQIAYLAKMNAEERVKEDSGEEEAPPEDKFEEEQHQKRKEHEEAQRWDPRPMWRIPYRRGTSFEDERYAQVYVVAVDGDEAKPRRLTDIDADHDTLSWTPDGAQLVTARTSDPERDEPWRWESLYRLRVSDGQAEQLTDDSHSDTRPQVSPDGQWIAYSRQPVKHRSEQIERLAIIPVTGGAARDLNREIDRSVAEFRWMADSSGLVCLINNQGNTEIHTATLVDGKIEKTVDGIYEAQGIDVAANGGVTYVASISISPPELFWKEAGADEARQMTQVNKKLLDEVIVQETHEIRFMSPSGTEIQGWYILPAGYEEGKKYPLAFNMHGGPHAMWGPSAKSMWHEWQTHAARGYMVFYCNPRGSRGYGQAFLSALRAAWGDVAFEDLMAGLGEILRMDIVDPKRMALTGGSYGGYLTAWIVGHDMHFACAVTQRGVYNLLSMYGTTDIPGFLTDEQETEPWEDPEFLWQHSPLAYAHHIQTPLLIIHSENDYRVPIEQAEQLFAYIKRSGDTPVRMLRYPRDGHELSRSGEPKHRVSRLTEMIAWFDQYCMPDKSED